MAKNNNLGDFLKGIADKIRAKLSSSDPINPQDFEDKIDAVYESGKDAQYDEFWDGFQQNGDRAAYEYAFANVWTNEMFKPKYNINVKLGNHSNIFSYSNITGSLKTILEELGITLSFYQIPARSSGANYLFVGTKFTELPALDFSQALGDQALQAAFVDNRYLETIEKLILPANCTGYGTRTFTACPALQNIKFEGTIKYSLSFADCPLSADSVNSILGHLDSSAFSGERTITLKSSSVTAHNTKYGDTYPDSAEAQIALLNSEGANWTLALV